MSNVDPFTAIADPHRRFLLEELRRAPKTVSELAEGLPISRPAVSQHLKVLKEADLVTDRPEGNRRIYQLNPDGLGALRAYLDRFWNQALPAFKGAVEQKAKEKQ